MCRPAAPSICFDLVGPFERSSCTFLTLICRVPPRVPPHFDLCFLHKRGLPVSFLSPIRILRPVIYPLLFPLEFGYLTPILEAIPSRDPLLFFRAAFSLINGSKQPVSSEPRRSHPAQDLVILYFPPPSPCWCAYLLLVAGKYETSMVFGGLFFPTVLNFLHSILYSTPLFVCTMRFPLFVFPLPRGSTIATLYFS